ncbi:ribonuclease Z [Haloquadratum walsbyi]|jgi:Metal-dependent hydrolases of the beta-lactamase superfamily III|uniref:Ribonuclease Z n=1 Tax=Haloquadratum walsbyi J07HQW2 TaxID=1238425 RepID=U1NJI7_9EURY|nr:ribonuclease Z [Haloquadratum walsbyi]ERG97113.1 MAG: metal-dependent hydrolase of the beta-lactamase superfamily III [Haloquadratum walsbyi J07HQW2]
MQVTAIGTSGGLPTSQYGTSCIYLNLFGDKILFDCGEGSQQRLMKYDSSPNVDAVFISHFHADHTLGLPGLIQALEMDERERPLDIYVPEQRKQRTNDMITGAYEWPSYPVKIHGYDESDPAIQTDNYTIQPFNTPYTEHSHGLSVQETPKREFLVKKAQELGINPGPKYGKLQNGHAIETDDGDTVEPEDVLSEPKPGRKIVYTGDTRPSDAIIDAASDASLLIYSAMFTEALAERARSTGHSTASEAAQVASKSGSQKIWLTHISPRHEGEEQKLKSQANNEFDGEIAVVRDGDVTQIT